MLVFEYRVIRTLQAPEESFLDEMGRLGWELIQILPTPLDNRHAFITYLRRVQA